MIRIANIRIFAGLFWILSLATMRCEAQALSQLANDPLYAGIFGQLERVAATTDDTALTALNNCSRTGACPAGSVNLQAQLNALSGAASGVSCFSSNNNGCTPTAADLATARQLAVALRGTAPEELSAQRTMSAAFAHSQLSNLTTRLDALQRGAMGFSIAGFSVVPNQVLAANRQGATLAGGAGADADVPADFSRWGGFLNSSYGWGTRSASNLEDAFTSHGTDWSLGVDYRYSRNFVFGGMVGYSNQWLNFDPNKSPTAGSINAKGTGATLYAVLEWDGPYVSASLGRQRLSNDTVRRIQYQITNPPPNPPTNVDITARGTADNTALTGTLDAGWSFHQAALSYEPFVRLTYRKTEFDAFTESSTDNFTGNPAGFEFNYGDRSTRSLDGALGAKVQYAFTQKFGVVVPYLQAAYHHEFKNDPLNTTGGYAVLTGLSGAGTSTFSSDTPDSSYYGFAAGSSVVFKHGMQAFLQIQSVAGLRYVHNSVVGMGLRGEF